MKRKIFGFFLIVVIVSFFSEKSVSASGASVELSTEQSAVTSGNKFVVKMSVTSAANFHKIKGFLTYDSKLVRYLSSDDGITGGNGKLKIDVEDIFQKDYVEEYEEDYGKEDDMESEDHQKIFHITFRAIGTGKVSFQFINGLKIYDEKGAEMSLSINSLDLVVKSKRESSGISSLSDLKITDYPLIPDFSKNVFQYATEVLGNIDRLTIKATPTDDNAKIVIAGNGKFQEGDNLVKVIVTAEDGTESVYEIIITKHMLEEETSVEKTKQKVESKAEEGDVERNLPKNDQNTEEEGFSRSLSVTKESLHKSSSELSSIENIEKSKPDRKKQTFYVIIGLVALVASLTLVFFFRKLKKMEDKDN